MNFLRLHRISSKCPSDQHFSRNFHHFPAHLSHVDLASASCSQNGTSPRCIPALSRHQTFPALSLMIDVGLHPTSLLLPRVEPPPKKIWTSCIPPGFCRTQNQILRSSLNPEPVEVTLKFIVFSNVFLGTNHCVFFFAGHKSVNVLCSPFLSTCRTIFTCFSDEFFFSIDDETCYLHLVY